MEPCQYLQLKLKVERKNYCNENRSGPLGMKLIQTMIRQEMVDKIWLSTL